jgi:hypothetical protein
MENSSQHSSTPRQELNPQKEVLVLPIRPRYLVKTYLAVNLCMHKYVNGNKDKVVPVLN